MLPGGTLGSRGNLSGSRGKKGQGQRGSLPYASSATDVILPRSLPSVPLPIFLALSFPLFPRYTYNSDSFPQSQCRTGKGGPSGRGAGPALPQCRPAAQRARAAGPGPRPPGAECPGRGMRAPRLSPEWVSFPWACWLFSPVLGNGSEPAAAHGCPGTELCAGDKVRACWAEPSPCRPSCLLLLPGFYTCGFITFPLNYTSLFRGNIVKFKQFLFCPLLHR